MKYIRTENGILKVDGYDNSGTCVIKTNTYAKTYYKEDYIKMTDTIEELCDEFVIVFEDGHIMTDLDYESFGKEWYKNNHIRMKNAQYYGAIWIDKGLIYVAKLNENGEFELI